jgi:hypothetical protein
MRNKDGKHNFTNSYKKHLNNINRVKSVKKWNIYTKMAVTICNL